MAVLVAGRNLGPLRLANFEPERLSFPCSLSPAADCKFDPFREGRPENSTEDTEKAERTEGAEKAEDAERAERAESAEFFGTAAPDLLSALPRR